MAYPTAFQTLDQTVRTKAEALYDNLAQFETLAVAFSGGVDSSVVAAVAALALGERMMAVTVVSPVETPGDHQAAVAVAQAAGFQHMLVTHDDFATAHFAENPPDRCYFCKRARFEALMALARARGIAHLAEGSNADDQSDYRPGMRAVNELQVHSPLAEVSLTKPEIRAIAQALHLPVWDRPSAPCLATRFPYGCVITPPAIRQVAQGEAILLEQGYTQVRLRHFEDPANGGAGPLARLEVNLQQIQRLQTEIDALSKLLHEIGYAQVEIDARGYRSGSLNESLLL